MDNSNLSKDQKQRFAAVCKTLSFDEAEYFDAIEKFGAPESTIAEWENIAELFTFARMSFDEMNQVTEDDLVNICTEVVVAVDVASSLGEPVDEEEMDELADILELDRPIVAALVKKEELGRVPK